MSSTTRMRFTTTEPRRATAWDLALLRTSELLSAGRGGDRAHEATTILVREAWHEAGDASKYPEQFRKGLRPWQPKKLYFTYIVFPRAEGGRGGRGGAGRSGAARESATPKAPLPELCKVNTAIYDPLLGRTYAVIGFEAHNNHKCQGMTGLPPLPGVPGGRGGPNLIGYQFLESTIPGQVGKDETSLFEGIDTSLSALAQFAGSNPTAALTGGLAAIVAEAKRAQKAFDDGNDEGTAVPIEAGLAAVRALRAQLASLPVSDSARYEIDYRLKIKGARL
jgi:hypothetical protein